LALDNFRIEQGQLSFDDLAEKYGVGAKRSYQVSWSVFDNSDGTRAPIESDGISWTVPTGAGAQTGFLSAAIRLPSSQPGGAGVTVYLRRSANEWNVVGIDRRYE
jgi:hypothetical protein